jgi:class 3 adenylate cyclase
MAKLSPSERAKLPASAFAYIDSAGHRRLPIHDEAHVRNALSRFERVKFEDDAARERARKRLLNAAKKYGIVPVGFITGQLRTERKQASADGAAIERERMQGEMRAGATEAATLPVGFVTFLLTDIEASTALLRTMGDAYGGLLDDVRGAVRGAIVRGKGREVDARADEFFAVFTDAAPALEAAMRIQRTLAKRTWGEGQTCRVRIGIHSGRPTLTDTGYIGLSVHAAARVCQAGHGGQILVSTRARRALRDLMPSGVRLRSLGRHELPGLMKPETLYQVEAEGLLTDFPPLRTGA